MAEDVRILVVESDADLAALLRECLGDEFTVRCVSDGPAAVAELRALDPDALVVDVDVLTIDGAPFAARAREEGLPPIIALSAVASGPRVARGLGAVACVSKPFDVDELASLIRLHARRR